MIKKLNFSENSFFYNTFIILMTGFVIKFLGLINRIFITRTLGVSGMTLYIMSFPTIMLFINISSMGLNISISKLVSESIKTKQYSPYILLKKAILIALTCSAITIIIFLLFLYPLTHYLLKNDNLFFPLLSTIFLIPLVGISDSLKGYFNGLKLMKYSSSSNLIEQIARIIFSIICLYITLPYGVKTATFYCLLSLSIGELSSIIFSIIKIKKIKIIHYEKTKGELQAILKISIPNTLSHLVGNFTYFLEPIIYVWILSLLNYPHHKIESTYTIVNAFTISLLTLGSFVSNALATTVVPTISEAMATNNISAVNYYIKKSLIFSLIPGLFITIILFFYPSELMQLIYSTKEGSQDVKLYVFLFIPYYIQAPLSSIYQSLGKSKSLFKISCFFNVTRLLLIILFSLFNAINYQSLMLATTITMICYIFIVFWKIKKLTTFRVSFHNSVTLVIIFIFSFFCILLCKTLNINYLISITIVGVIYLLWCYKCNLINIKSLNKIR